MVAGGQLLQALHVGGEPVRGLDEVEVLAVRLLAEEERTIVRLELDGDHVEQLPVRDGLDGLVRDPDVRVEVLDRGREVARQHLARVVEESERGRAFRIGASPKQPVADHPQRVRDHRHPQAVLLDVLRVGIVHQAPSPDELHPRQICEEVAHATAPPEAGSRWRDYTGGGSGASRRAAARQTLDVEALLRHHGHMRLGAAVGLGIVLLLPALGWAQVYRWEDEGTLHFTNTFDRIPEPHRSQLGPPPPVSANRADELAPALSETITRIPYTPGSPIFVSAHIGGAGPVTLILDTGADRTMVSPEALGRLGIATTDAPLAQIRGVTGMGQGSVVQVASVEVGQARVGPLRIIAHDAELRKADGLLGRDFLEHFTVTIDSKGQQVTLTPK